MKKLKVISLIFCLNFVLDGCQPKTKQGTKESSIGVADTLGLTLAWQSDSLLTTCESVIYDSISKVIYVSNINKGPWEKDGNGFLSKLDIYGNIIELKWVEGLNAPKGLGIVDGKLFVTDIDEIVEVSIAEGLITNRYLIRGNPQLNDITIDELGVVYASGSNTNTIYALSAGELTKTYPVDSAQRLNGLVASVNGMYFLDFNTSLFGLMDLNGGAIKVLARDLGKSDGIVKLPNEDFITTGWMGQIFYIDGLTGQATLLLDSRDQSIGAADIDYIADQNLLLVPTFFHNRVMAYKLKM